MEVEGGTQGSAFTVVEPATKEEQGGTDSETWQGSASLEDEDTTNGPVIACVHVEDGRGQATETPRDEDEEEDKDDT
jgi:hypothetical protein